MPDIDLPSVDEDEREEVYQDFKDRVNMAPKELEEWLETEESKAAGDSDDGESTGHAMGRNIVDIKKTNKDDLSDEQYRQMKKVVNYVGRHTAQRPDGDVEDTTWCHSLKNWGHDPTK